MLNQIERSLALRRWLSVAVAFLLSAGIWAVGSHSASAATWTVEATDFAFTPAELTVAVGDTVTWHNGDAESHAVEGGSLSSPEIRAGESYSKTFTAPEDISYTCRFHTYMTGTIHVVAGGATTTSAPATTAPPTTSPPTTGDTSTTTPGSSSTTSTTVAPTPSGPGFQEMPDDPSARKPPGEPISGPSPDDDDPPTSTPTTAPPSTTTTTSPGGSTPTSTTSPGFQDVPNDPSGGHPPGELASTPTDEGDPPDDSTPTTGAPPGGDGTVLARPTEVDGVKEFHLTMDETSIEVSPGVVKPAYAFNGTVPGPTIRVDEGDRVRIVVDNRLPFATSTHWHGMILPNDQDGVGGITQPHIAPGEQYVYEWTAVATGTHWYHAHSSGRHIGKGLYGALEVVPDEGDFESDRDYRLMLGDTDLGFTLNGRSFPSTPTLDAEVGETVRLRLINTGDQVHAMHLHGVPFTVVAQDGMPRVQPEQMDTLTIAPGQTFDLLFEQVYPGKWLIHCHMFVHSHMNADEHPPGESGMNGMVAVVNVTPASGGDDLSLVPISTVGSEPNWLVLLGVGGLLAHARRTRRRSQPPIQRS
jgi:FtsP/CotA-like multicopper oxidase with cupredoxin domain